jgi:hypothetical protein
MTPQACETKAGVAIRNVLLACRSYAADHDAGAYPPDRAALTPGSERVEWER